MASSGEADDALSPSPAHPRRHRRSAHEHAGSRENQPSLSRAAAAPPIPVSAHHAGAPSPPGRIVE